MKQGRLRLTTLRALFTLSGADEVLTGVHQAHATGRWCLLTAFACLVPIGCRPAAPPAKADNVGTAPQVASVVPTESPTQDPTAATTANPNAVSGQAVTNAVPPEPAMPLERPANPVETADRPPARPGLGGEGSESATVTDPVAKARRQAARPLRPGAVNDITFDDLELDMPLNTLFNRSLLTPRAAQLDGQLVRLRGFIFAGGVFQQSGIKSFPFVKNTQCKFGPDGLAFCVILVDLDEGVSTDFTTYPVTVEGRLSVQPYDAEGFTWSVYHLQGRRVF